MSMSPAEIGSMIVSHWHSAFNQALAPITPSPVDQTRVQMKSGGLENAESENVEGESEYLWWHQNLAGLAQPALWIGGTKQTWEALGSAVLRSLGFEDATGDDSRAAARDIVAQATTELLRKLNADFGTQLTCTDPETSDTPPGTPNVVAIPLPEGLDSGELKLVFNAGVLEELAKLSGPAEPGSATATAPVEPTVPTLRALPKPIADLSFLLNVVLGRTSLSLDTVLGLNVGSVIDLGQSVTDLVTVMINGNTIAAGQLVVCNGNYAIQVRRAERSELV